MYRILVDGVYVGSFDSFCRVVAFILSFCEGKTFNIQFLGDDY